MTDLQIGPQILIEPECPFLRVDPHSQVDMTAFRYMTVVLPGEIPGITRLLCSTLSRVEAPLGMYGIVTLRSTWARLGLISPCTVVDPGFVGNLTLEVYNSSRSSILLRPTDKLFSIVWVIAADLTTKYTGRYQGQIGVQPSKVLED